MNKAAQALGRLGGKATSEAKRAAARENWKKAAAALRKKRKAANTQQRNIRTHKLAKFLSVSPFFTAHTTDPGIAAERALAVWIPIATLVCGIAGYLLTN